MLVTFDGIARPIAFVGCDSLLTLCAEIMHGWGFAPAAERDAPPVVTVRRKDGRYLIEADWLEEPVREASEVSAICSFLVDLVRAYLANDPSLLCLHCGAAEFAGRLVIFPSTYRAGKSTLTARLAAEGVRIFADDVLPITANGNRGMALGLAPRLRLPLPESAGADFRRFVAEHSGPSDGYYLYLALPAARVPHHGLTALVGAFVLLDRQPDGAAELVPAARSEGLRQVILRNFASAGGVEERFERLRSLVGETPCFRLRYSDLEEAAALLKDCFVSWDSPMTHAEAPPVVHQAIPPPDVAIGTRRPRSNSRRGMLYVQIDGVLLHALGGDLFLVDPRNQAIFHLNVIGAGLWNLLREPTSPEEAAAVIQGAFPEMDAEIVERDVRALLVDLHHKGLVEAGLPARGR